MTNKYDEDYFIRGTETGKSLYTNYRWLPDLTKPMAQRIVDHLGINREDKILDFGCARGYLVRAFTELGYDAHGVDISDWAIENCDETVKRRVMVEDCVPKGFDWIIAKDCLEHLDFHEVTETICDMTSASKGVFVVVPLAGDNGKYVVPEYEQDITHVVRWNLGDWVNEFHQQFDGNGDWEISARHRIVGIKDNYSQFEKGNGFITARRI